MAEKKKILIIDDEENFGKMLQVNLEMTEDYEVYVQTRGMEGLQTAKNFQPDIILLDVIMPDMAGPDVAKQLKANDKTSHIPVLFLTAMPEGSVELKPFKEQQFMFIRKPISTEELIKHIEATIQKAREANGS